MENQEYVFEEKAENQGDEIIIGDIELGISSLNWILAKKIQVLVRSRHRRTSIWRRTRKTHLLEALFWKVP